MRPDTCRRSFSHGDAPGKGLLGSAPLLPDLKTYIGAFKPTCRNTNLYNGAVR